MNKVVTILKCVARRGVRLLLHDALSSIFDLPDCEDPVMHCLECVKREVVFTIDEVHNKFIRKIR
ncbi:hypothetical protein MAR_035162 [Mya arenaria]|uniref:Uncharacterized protein n=1 Tax=Mya arenaria TaxID=6604 RepID=A0ABY7EMY4_MYAAR|nr:hypothetical protein MAR_035162 [Mya arenaria]